MLSNELGGASPSLPAYFLYPVAALSLLIILFVMARTRDRAAGVRYWRIVAALT